MNNIEAYLYKKRLSEKNIQKIQEDIKRFQRWREAENIPEGNESYTDILAYVKYCTRKGNSKNTQSKYLNSLRHYYNYLIEAGERTDNPVSNLQIKGIRRKKLHQILNPGELETIYKNYRINNPAGKRNKVILGLILYQAVRTEELAKLEVKDIHLREGKIYIAGGRKHNERELKLEAHQIIDLMNYINETRKLLLAITEKESDKLFISMGKGTAIHNLIDNLIRTLRKQDPRIKDLKQVRASVITDWVKAYNLRKAQYLAGHKHISSTEAYKENDIEGLQEEINKYHPVN